MREVAIILTGAVLGVALSKAINKGLVPAWTMIVILFVAAVLVLM